MQIQANRISSTQSATPNQKYTALLQSCYNSCTKLVAFPCSTHASQGQKLLVLLLVLLLL